MSDFDDSPHWQEPWYIIDKLRAEVERLKTLATCRCGDSFTTDDPGQCGNCSVAQRIEVERLKAVNDDLWKHLTAEARHFLNVKYALGFPKSEAK